jgi:hypothetical protein
MWRSLVHTSRSPSSCAVVRCTASAVRMKRSRGADIISALVLRSIASLTGMKFHKPFSYVRGKARGQIACVAVRGHALAQAAMKHRMKLGKGPQRRIDGIRFSDKLANAGRITFIELELCDVGRVKTHGLYRLRSSSRIFVLSLTCGIRAQILRIEVKICAFLRASMRAGAVMGRNSATGSPRRSITIMPPSAASRTNFDVWM